MSKNTLRNVRTYRASQFSWSDGEGSAELSGLGVSPGVRFVDRLWDDACDEGFKVLSDRTGRTLVFVLDEGNTARGAGDEIMCWVFRAHGEEALKIVVFND